MPLGEVVPQVHHLAKRANAMKTITFTNSRYKDLDTLYANLPKDEDDLDLDGEDAGVDHQCAEENHGEEEQADDEEEDEDYHPDRDSDDNSSDDGDSSDDDYDNDSAGELKEILRGRQRDSDSENAEEEINEMDTENKPDIEEEQYQDHDGGESAGVNDETAGVDAPHVDGKEDVEEQIPGVDSETPGVGTEENEITGMSNNERKTNNMSLRRQPRKKYDVFT